MSTHEVANAALLGSGSEDGWDGRGLGGMQTIEWACADSWTGFRLYEFLMGVIDVKQRGFIPVLLMHLKAFFVNRRTVR